MTACWRPLAVGAVIITLFGFNANLARGQAGQLVTNPAPDPGAPAFQLSAQPVLVVGDGRDRDHDWGGGRADAPERGSVADAVLLSSGKLAVAMTGALPGVRVFAREGFFLYEVLERAEGVRQPLPRHLVSLTNDSLLVLDMANRRVVLIDGEGRSVRSANISTPRAVCCGSDGSFLLQSVVARQDPPTSNQVSRIRYSYSVANLHDPAGAVRRILLLEGAESPIVERFPSTAHPGSMAIEMLPRPFARPMTVAFAGASIIHAVGDAFQFDIYTTAGQKVRTVRAALQPRPITAEDIAAARREFVTAHATTPERRRALERTFGQLIHPSTMPAFGQVLPEEDGRIWVKGYADRSTTAEWWAAFAPTGELLGTLQIPSSKRVLRFSRGHVVLLDPVTASKGIRQKILVHRIEPKDG